MSEIQVSGPLRSFGDADNIVFELIQIIQKLLIKNKMQTRAWYLRGTRTFPVRCTEDKASVV